MDILQIITELSHEFGSDDYVKGGGGNTSCKDPQTLWVKPSGTTLSGLKPETFVALDREKINELYAIETPADAQARESLVKDVMSGALKPGSSGRASVEAPLHNVFDATFVVHTHPAMVNGMTCAKDGKSVCKKLFPDALWVDYIDPGYTLCMHVREEIEKYRATNGCDPAMLFLENHGVFISAESADEIRALYKTIMDTLKAEYDKAGVSTDLPIKNEEATVPDTIHELLGDEGAFVAVSSPFSVAQGPISPDHIVYSKSFPFADELSAENISAFKSKHSYLPRIIVADKAIYGVGSSQKVADLALLLAQDGALVQQLAEAFGGVQFMTDAARGFIENWEVESYRAKQMQ
jgi:rhamnose utilization protein RhaD (predicted bifunctional aldolase and dehydrogenase)